MSYTTCSSPQAGSACRLTQRDDPRHVPVMASTAASARDAAPRAGATARTQASRMRAFILRRSSLRTPEEAAVHRLAEDVSLHRLHDVRARLERVGGRLHV